MVRAGGRAVTGEQHAPLPDPDPEGGVGPIPGGGYPVPEPSTDPGPTRERWLWTAIVVGTGILIFGLMVFGGVGGVRPDLQQVGVGDVLRSDQLPADRYGSAEMRISGWFAQITAGCSGDTAGDAVSGWLEAACPTRVLLPERPTGPLDQTAMLRTGLRLAAPNGQPFPPQAPAGSGTAGLEQLVFVGHFDDRAADQCTAARVTLCRNTFVVTEYSGQIK
jgi:hypothetical protein